MEPFAGGCLFIDHPHGVEVIHVILSHPQPPRQELDDSLEKKKWQFSLAWQATDFKDYLDVSLEEEEKKLVFAPDQKKGQKVESESDLNFFVRISYCEKGY